MTSRRVFDLTKPEDWAILCQVQDELGEVKGIFGDTLDELREACNDFDADTYGDWVDLESTLNMEYTEDEYHGWVKSGRPADSLPNFISEEDETCRYFYCTDTCPGISRLSA